MNDQLLKPSDIAKLFNFDGVRRIDQLVQDGVLTPELVVERGKEVRRYPLVQTVQQYVDYLQEKANRKADGVDDPLTLEQMALADLRWKSARAGKAELELAELKGQMHRAEDVETVVSDMIARIRSSILALPGRLAVDTAEAKTPMETSAIIKAAVDDLLNETAEYRYNAADYKRLVSEREKWLSVKEAETVKKEAEKKTTQAKNRAKTASKKPAASSKTSEKVSKPRKT